MVPTCKTITLAMTIEMMNLPPKVIACTAATMHAEQGLSNQVGCLYNY